MTEVDEYPGRGSIAWERRGDEYVASEHGSELEARGDTPHQAIRNYLLKVNP